MASKVSEIILRVIADTAGVKTGMATTGKEVESVKSKVAGLSTQTEKTAQAVTVLQQRLRALAETRDVKILQGADVSGITKEINQVQSQLRSLQKGTIINVKSQGIHEAAESTGELRSELLGLVGITPGIVKMGAALGGLGLAFEAIKVATEDEQITVQLTQLVGSADAAVAALDKINTLVVKSPIAKGDWEAAAVTLAKFRIPAESIPDILSRLSNVAVATHQPLVELAQSVGQLNTAGVNQQRILTALAKQGVQVYAALAQALGITTDQVKELASQGKLSADAIDAMLSQLSEMNATAASAAVETLGGKIQVLRNEAEIAAERFGAALLPALKGVASVLETVGDAIDKVPDPLVTTVAAVAAFVTISKLMSATIKGAVTAIGALVPAMAAEAVAAEGAAVSTGVFRGALLGLEAAAGPLGLAVAGLGLLLGGLIPTMDDAADSAQGLGVGLDFSAKGATNANAQVVIHDLVDKTHEFSQAWDDAGVSIKTASDNIFKGGAAFDEMIARTQKQVDILHEQRFAPANTSEEAQRALAARQEEERLQRLVDLWKAERDAVVKAQEAGQRTNDVNAAMAGVTGEAADSLDDLSDAADRAKEALRAAQEAGKDFADSLVDAFDDSFRAATARLDLNAELKATLGPHGTEVEGLKAINQQLIDEKINLRDAALQREKLISQSAQLAVKQRDQLLSEGKGLDQANKAYLQILNSQEDQLRQLGLLDAQTKAYFDTLKSLPTQQNIAIKAVLKLPTVDEQKAAVLELADRLPNAAVQLGAIMKEDWFRDPDFVNSLLGALGPEGLEIAVKPIITPKAAADAAVANSQALKRARDEARLFGEAFVPPKKLTADDFMDKELQKLLSGASATTVANVNVVVSPPAADVKAGLDQAADPTGTGAGRTANINVTTTGTSPADAGTQLDQAANPNGRAREAGIQININPVPARELLDSLKYETGTKTDRIAGIQVQIDPKSLATAQSQLASLSNTSIVLFPTISQQALNNITDSVRGAVTAGQNAGGSGGATGSGGAGVGGRSVTAPPRVALTVQDGALANLIGVTVHDSVARSVRTITNRKVVHV